MLETSRFGTDLTTKEEKNHCVSTTQIETRTRKHFSLCISEVLIQSEKLFQKSGTQLSQTIICIPKDQFYRIAGIKTRTYKLR